MKINNNKTAKTTFWGAAIFYLLVAFEFAYMAGPFAFYFYAVYSPILDFFNQSPILSWLVSFFLPHVVRATSSPLINLHNIIGFLLVFLGFSGFLAGASQIYYYKLTKKGAVTGGIYNFIRHPQYVCFITCSFGMLLLWPRYIVLVMFITMLFAYYFLARAEERECEAKFGESYIEYKNKTNMFIPFKINLIKKFPSLPKSKFIKIISIIGIYIVSLAIGIGLALGANKLAVDNLYALFHDNSANIALCKVEKSTLENIMKIAQSDKEVQDKIESFKKNENNKFLNYVLPTEWFAAEIPMNGLKYRAGHRASSDYDKNLYKVIFTKAQIRLNKDVKGKEIIRNVSTRIPIVEVWVDLSKNQVIKVMDMPNEIKYENVPVAVY